MTTSDVEETRPSRLAHAGGNGIYLRYRDLVDMGACEERELFKKVFGSRVLVTVTTAVAAAQTHTFNWFWIAYVTLSEDVYSAIRRRAAVLYGDDYCICSQCDPDRLKSRFIAQGFAEAFLAQGGMAGRKR